MGEELLARPDLPDRLRHRIQEYVRLKLLTLAPICRILNLHFILSVIGISWVRLIRKGEPWRRKKLEPTG